MLIELNRILPGQLCVCVCAVGSFVNIHWQHMEHLIIVVLPEGSDTEPITLNAVNQFGLAVRYQAGKRINGHQFFV